VDQVPVAVGTGSHVGIAVVEAGQGDTQVHDRLADTRDIDGGRIRIAGATPDEDAVRVAEDGRVRLGSVQRKGRARQGRQERQYTQDHEYDANVPTHASASDLPICRHDGEPPRRF